MSGWRLQSGGPIDRNLRLSFQWDGRSYAGFAGDTLASALIANGISLVGRSLKYHRPRGLFAAGLEEPNGIVQLEVGGATIPNLKATQVELYDGLIAAPVNAKPSLDFDLMAANSLVKRFIPAAFYYKTFMWPGWHWFEPSIRRAAGLGIAPAEADPDTYEHRFAHTDILVVGAGAAGIAAALAAAESGGSVMLVESDPELGGGLREAEQPVEGRSAAAWLEEAAKALTSKSNVTVLRRTTAFGFYDHGLVGLHERIADHLPPDRRHGPRQRLWKIRCARVVLATGAFERPLPFARNDLPGVMLASSALSYLRRYAVVPGRNIVVATNNDSAYAVALAFHDAGIQIGAIIDSRATVGECARRAEEKGIRLILGAAPLRAKGRRRIESVSFAPVSSVAETGSLVCDTLLVSGGWNPTVHLHSQSGGTLAFDDALQAFLPKASPQNSLCIGALAGIFDVQAAIISAREAVRHERAPQALSAPAGPMRQYEDGHPDAAAVWVDLQNDVTVADLHLAARENFRSVEHVKRYTTLGMGSDQGKTSNVAGIQVLANLFGKAPQEIGTTRFRPPFDPVSIGAFAGRAVGDDLDPIAHTAAHAEQQMADARMEDYGHWKRAAYFTREGEDEHASVRREVLAVRNSVGVFDASPLGKIEVKGPDAAEFLQRMYANSVRTLAVGRCRYGLMLNENGVVYDDGVLTRLADDHFLVGTTSGHAAAISETFEEWLQCEWRHLRVLAANVTTAWAVINIAGPRARDVLAAIGTDIDLTSAAFPHMSYRAGNIAGVPARVMRVSFSGELSYEVAVPWGFGGALWAAAMRAGKAHDIAPFGIEALMVMRVEKGFLHVGTDTDGTTLPQDIGFGPLIEKKLDDFVGRRSTMRPDGLRADRRQLVGIEVTDEGPALAAGAHLLPADAVEPRGTIGWVTSSAMSPVLNRPIAMALVSAGRSRMGENIRVWDMGTWRSARICDQRFYDPAGERLNG